MENREWKQRDRQYHENPAVVEQYDRVVTKKYRLEHKYFTIDKWADKLKNTKAKAVLDFGCGTGIVTLKLLERGIRTMSIDVSLAMLQRLRKKAKENILNDKCVAGDVENLPFKDEVFDGLICAGVLHHVADIEKSVKNQIRVLKKNGLLFITEPFVHKPWFSYPYHMFVALVISVATFFKKQKLKTKEHVLTKSDVEAISTILKNNSFEYSVSYLAYWPLICSYIPECISFPLICLLNRINRGSNRGDSVIFTARKLQ